MSRFYPRLVATSWSFGIIRGILFVIAAYLFFLSMPNEFATYGDGSFNRSISEILPFETYIHLGVFASASTSLFRNTNTLTFAMSKLGSGYLAVFGIFQLIVSIHQAIYIHHKYYLDFYMQHVQQRKMTSFSIFVHFYNNHPVSFIPMLVNFTLALAGMTACANVNYIRKIKIQNEILAAATNTTKRFHSCSDCTNNDCMDLDSAETATLLSNEDTMHTHSLNESRKRPTRVDDGFFATSTNYQTLGSNSKKQTKCLKLLNVSIICQYLWFVTYCGLLTLHHTGWLVDVSEHKPLISDENLTLPFNYWIVGYATSFTMVLHRAFIVSAQYRLLYSNKWNHDVSIFFAAGLIMVPLVLNIGYLIKMIIMSRNNTQISLVSLILIVTDTMIEIVVLCCLFLLYCLIPSEDLTFYNDIKRVNSAIDAAHQNYDFNYLSPRLTVWHMTNIDETIWAALQPKLKTDSSVIQSNKYYAKMIGISVTLAAVCMILIENMVYISVNTYYSSSKDVFYIFDNFNKILLWSFHLTTLWFFGFVRSIYIASKFDIIKRPLTNLFGVVMLIVGILMPLFDVMHQYLEKSSTGWMLPTTLVFYTFRAVLCILFLIGLNGFKSIEKSEYLEYLKKYKKIQSQIQCNQKDFKHKRLMTTKIGGGLVISLLIMEMLYIVVGILRSDWDCDLITLNMNYYDYDNDHMITNWFMFGGETIMFGTAFHVACLVNIFLIDAIYTKYWYPSYDFARATLVCIIILGTWQILNATVFIGIKTFLTQPTMMLMLAMMILISLRLLVMLCEMDNLFTNRSEFLLNDGFKIFKQ